MNTYLHWFVQSLKSYCAILSLPLFRSALLWLFVCLLIGIATQAVKLQYTVNDRITFKLFKRTIDFDMKRFILTFVGLLSLGVNVANDYLAHPEPAKTVIGNTAIVIAAVTFLHRFGISPFFKYLLDWKAYLSAARPAVGGSSSSSGSPSA